MAQSEIYMYIYIYIYIFSCHNFKSQNFKLSVSNPEKHVAYVSKNIYTYIYIYIHAHIYIYIYICIMYTHIQSAGPVTNLRIRFLLDTNDNNNNDDHTIDNNTWLPYSALSAYSVK